jgi:hypothetical protein
VQPNVISKYMSGAQDAQDDGFLQRFIPGLVPDSEASRVGIGKPDYLSYRHQWEQTVRQAYSATKGGKSYTLDNDGQALFNEYEHWLENLKAEERLILSDANLQSAFGKLFGLTGRIALIFHLIENPSAITVPASAAQNAIAWVKSYVIPALRHFYGMGDKQERIDRWIAEHILTAPESVLSVSDIVRSARRAVERLKLSSWQATSAVETCLITLCNAGWTTALALGHGEKSPRYAINPELRVRYSAKRQTIAQIKQKRIDAVREISRKITGTEPAKRYARGLERCA